MPRWNPFCSVFLSGSSSSLVKWLKKILPLSQSPRMSLSVDAHLAISDATFLSSNGLKKA